MTAHHKVVILMMMKNFQTFSITMKLLVRFWNRYSFSSWQCWRTDNPPSGGPKLTEWHYHYKGSVM